MNVAVFISGKGSNLSALLDQQQLFKYKVSLVISNNKNAEGLNVAKKYSRTCLAIDWSNKQKAEAKAAKFLQSHRIKLVVLAGFMKILTADFIQNIGIPIINIHPSLLPHFSGLQTHARAIKAKHTQHGATVHLVDAGLDTGQPIARSVVNIDSLDTASALAKKVLLKEHKLLPAVVGLIANNTITIDGDKVFIQQKPLLKPLTID